MGDYLAEANQQFLEGGRWRARRMGEEAELAMFNGQVRRTLSLVAVRSQAHLLLDRLDGIRVAQVVQAFKPGFEDFSNL